MLTFTIEDADPGDNYTILLDSENDGTFSDIGSGTLGDNNIIDFFMTVPPNSSIDISFMIVEDYTDYDTEMMESGTNSSAVVNATIPGATLVATPIISTFLEGTTMLGELGATDNYNHTVEILQREAGTTEWMNLGEAWGGRIPC